MTTGYRDPRGRVVRRLILAPLVCLAWGCPPGPEAVGTGVFGVEMGLEVAMTPGDTPLTVAECEAFSEGIAWTVLPVEPEGPLIQQDLEEVEAFQGGFDDGEPPAPLPNRCRYTTSKDTTAGTFEVTVHAVLPGAEPFIESCEIGTFSSAADAAIARGWAGFTFGTDGCVASTSVDPGYEEYPLLP